MAAQPAEAAKALAASKMKVAAAPAGGKAQSSADHFDEDEEMRTFEERLVKTGIWAPGNDGTPKLNG